MAHRYVKRNEDRRGIQVAPPCPLAIDKPLYPPGLLNAKFGRSDTATIDDGPWTMALIIVYRHYDEGCGSEENQVSPSVPSRIDKPLYPRRELSHALPLEYNALVYALSPLPG